MHSHVAEDSGKDRRRPLQTDQSADVGGDPERRHRGGDVDSRARAQKARGGGDGQSYKAAPISKTGDGQILTLKNKRREIGDAGAELRSSRNARQRRDQVISKTNHEGEEKRVADAGQLMCAAEKQKCQHRTKKQQLHSHGNEGPVVNLVAAVGIEEAVNHGQSNRAEDRTQNQVRAQGPQTDGGAQRQGSHEEQRPDGQQEKLHQRHRQPSLTSGELAERKRAYPGLRVAALVLLVVCGHMK